MTCEIKPEGQADGGGPGRAEQTASLCRNGICRGPAAIPSGVRTIDWEMECGVGSNGEYKPGRITNEAEERRR